MRLFLLEKHTLFALLRFLPVTSQIRFASTDTALSRDGTTGVGWRDTNREPKKDLAPDRAPRMGMAANFAQPSSQPMYTKTLHETWPTCCDPGKILFSVPVVSAPLRFVRKRGQVAL